MHLSVAAPYMKSPPINLNVHKDLPSFYYCINMASKATIHRYNPTGGLLLGVLRKACHLRRLL
jgi:hypothetical protein